MAYTFLEIGGTSIKAVHIIEEIELNYKCRLVHAVDYLLTKTLAQCLEYIRNVLLKSTTTDMPKTKRLKPLDSMEGKDDISDGKECRVVVQRGSHITYIGEWNISKVSSLVILRNGIFPK